MFSIARYDTSLTVNLHLKSTIYWPTWRLQIEQIHLSRALKRWQKDGTCWKFRLCLQVPRT